MLVDGKPIGALPDLPDFESYVEIDEAARASSELGLHDKAKELAHAGLSRYPGPATLSTALYVAWRAGDVDRASELLRKPPTPSTNSDWTFRYGAAFSDVFGKGPVGPALAAFDKLGGLTTPENLGQIVRQLPADAYDLRFQLGSRLKAGGIQQLDLDLVPYAALYASKGPQEALKWLEARVSKQARQPLSVIAFAAHDDELMWTLVEPGPPGEGNDAVWLARAASWLRTHDAEHEAELRGHYAIATGGKFHQMGRYLLGLIDDAAIAKLATNERETCEIAYYMGHRAEMEGRLADAAELYLVAVETRSERAFEYRMAIAALESWGDSVRGPSTLKPRFK